MQNRLSSAAILRFFRNPKKSRTCGWHLLCFHEDGTSFYQILQISLTAPYLLHLTHSSLPRKTAYIFRGGLDRSQMEQPFKKKKSSYLARAHLQFRPQEIWNEINNVQVKDCRVVKSKKNKLRAEHETLVAHVRAPGKKETTRRLRT